MRVLLVEDNAALREEVSRTIQAIAGAQVVKAAWTSEQARLWLQAHPDGWDLALVDLFLEQGNGFEVLRSCRRLGAHQKVAVMTNYTREPVRSYVRQAGADAFFDKSFDMEALVDYCVDHASTLARLDGQRRAQPG
jgi:DNA-binding NarL/FixJ family response regulator